MPQLDLATFPSQLFWLAITFAILYLVMTFVGLPRVGGIIEKRRAKISGDLDKAQRMKAEAEAVIAAYERAIAEARTKAQTQLRETADRLNAEAAEQQKKLADSLRAETAQAESRIAAAKTSAMEGVKAMAAEVARAAAAKLVGGEIDAHRIDAAVDQALKERA